MAEEERIETAAGGAGANGGEAQPGGGGSWEERARRAEAALEEALAERNRLWEELHRRAARDDELEHYRSLVASMEGSASWRLTKPVRDAKRLALTGRSAARSLAARARARLREGR